MRSSSLQAKSPESPHRGHLEKGLGIKRAFTSQSLTNSRTFTPLSTKSSTVVKPKSNPILFVCHNSRDRTGRLLLVNHFIFASSRSRDLRHISSHV
jgi:protein tyrosine/serine phosphatase